MTAAAFGVVGVPKTYVAKPADTNEATIFTAGQKGALLVGIVLCNNDGSARTATVQWHDGTTDWEIVTALSVAANTTTILEPFISIPAAGLVKITQGTNSGITFHVTVVENIGVIGGRQAL